MTPVEGHIIRAGLGEALVPGPQRVLAVFTASDTVWMIGLPRAVRAGEAKKSHMLAPGRYSICEVSEALEHHQLVMESVALPGMWQMTDADYLRDSLNPGERRRREARLNVRDARWKVVEAILGKQVAREVVPVLGSLRQKILATAEEFDVSVPSVYSWLHRYLAGGQCLNSLLPNTDRCGNPGQRKATSRRRLGRKSRLAKAGLIPGEGYVLKEGDVDRLARGYSLVKPGKTVQDAYFITMGAFWSRTTQDERGHVQYQLLAQHERPTKPQFEYWGRKLYGDPFRRRLLGIDEWATSTLAVTGSALDQVHAVGQMAMIDSTSIDVYLTSMLSRLKVLPPMHRTIIKDVRSTLLLGFYLSWEDPSSATSLQAILSASSDKREFAAGFGIELEEGEWPGMLPRHFLADNGEMKSEPMKEGERQFRFGIEFVKAYSGQSKSQVENQHHTDHKALDHKLPGTTRGKQRKRGEQPPATQALWNYHEYVREFILGCVAYNNEEVPDLAPTDLKLEGLPPTRLNIFCWLRDHNQRADIPCDLDLLRSFTLPDHDAVLGRGGIQLLTDKGTRQLSGHRYFTEQLTRDARWQHVVRKGRPVKIIVKFDAQNLRHVWLPTEGGLVKVPNVLAEQDLLEGLTLVDWLAYQAAEDLRTDQARQAADQAGLDALVRRGNTSGRAASEKAHEQTQLPSKPSKREKPANLRQNKKIEQDYLSAPAVSRAMPEVVFDGIGQVVEKVDSAALAMKVFRDRPEP